MLKTQRTSDQEILQGQACETIEMFIFYMQLMETSDA